MQPGTRALTRPAVLLGAVMVTAAIVRSIIAWGHSVPQYFPDEYVYASLGRSIAHGHLQVDGHAALFPALLEPLLAAPLWALFPIQTAYHLVQVQNAIAASLVAIPVYLLARRLGLGSTFTVLCALYAVLAPTLVMIPLNLTDFIAYPLVLTSLLLAQRALERPTPRSQLLFVGAAAVTILARTEYVVLVPAYLVAAVMLDRRRVVRRHATALVAFAPAGLAMLVAGTGYFHSTVHHIPLNATTVTQIALQGFLMTLVGGVVIVPGAIVGIWRPGDRATAAFGALVAAFTLFLVSEIGIFSVTTLAKFRERYLFAIAPLLALSFGVYLRRGRPYPWAVFLISVGLAIAAARIPVSAYSTGAARFDSQTLIALDWLQKHSGPASTSLVVAGLLTIGGVWAVLIGTRGRGAALALPAALALILCFNVLATRAQDRSNHNVRADLPANLQWIDATAHGPVTAIMTPVSSGIDLLEQLYWNESVTRILGLDYADLPDQYSGPSMVPGSDGTLPVPPGFFLFDAEGSQATFSNAQLISTRFGQQLWRSDQRPRLRTLIEGRWQTGWLIDGGVLRAWPRRPQPAARVRLSFELFVPRTWPIKPTFTLNHRHFSLTPGTPLKIDCTGPGGARVFYSTSTAIYAGDTPLSMRLSHLRVTDLPGTSGATHPMSCSRA